MKTYGFLSVEDMRRIKHALTKHQDWPTLKRFKKMVAEAIKDDHPLEIIGPHEEKFELDEGAYNEPCGDGDPAILKPSIVANADPRPASRSKRNPRRHS